MNLNNPMEPKMSGGLEDVPEDGTPGSFEKNVSEADDIGMSTTAVEERQELAQPGTTGSVDDIQALKTKIRELESQAKDLRKSRQREAWLYNHRKEWEENVGPGRWINRNYYDARPVTCDLGEDQKWQIDFMELETERSYDRPDPFDPSHDCAAVPGGPKKEYDIEIDFGHRRDRIRKYYEWELDRMFLAEEEDKRRRTRLKQAEQQKERDRREIERKEQLAQLGGEEGKDKATAKGEIAVNAWLPAFAEPKLNWLDWYAFSRLAQQEERDACVVDILVGEPILDDDLTNNRLWFGYSNRRARKFHNVKAGKAVDSLIPGKDALPERIRIHSDALLRILSIILGSDAASLSDVEEAVMLRPFKALAYRAQALRDWCAALDKQFKKKEKRTNTEPVQDKSDPDLTSTKVDATTTGKPGSKAPSHTSTVKPESADEGEKLKEPQEKGERRTVADADEGENPDEEEDEEEDEEDKEGTEKDVTRSQIALEHLRCLINFMDTTIEPRGAYLNSPECRKVLFSDLWQLFRPGVEVIDSNGRQAYRVIGVTNAKHRVTPTWARWYNPSADKDSGKRTRPPFSVMCVHIDFDGKHVGPVPTTFDFQSFDGEREVTTLELYPLRFHPVKQSDFDEEEWKELEAVAPLERYRRKLIRRGTKFLEVAAVKHMYYAGPTLDVRDEVESPVVIDFETTFTRTDDQLKRIADEDPRDHTQTRWKPRLLTLIGNVNLMHEDLGWEDGGCRGACCQNDFVHDDQYVDQRQRAEYIESLLPQASAVDEQPPVAIMPRALKELLADPRGVSEADLVIMSYRVFGFVLRSRKWAKLDLSYLTDMRTEETPASKSPKKKEPVTAFNRLVLEKGHESMIVSLIAQHFRDKKSSTGHREEFDIVKGKGKGLILLLHGAPGVGKTSTAEGVAEMFKKPLFQITCGKCDLGTTAPEVEKALEMNFSLANRWDCILLLDEADVFLAERTKEDFKRNGLVAVFLRLMEYYAGILFLTTNRVGDFDEAFTSRIHVSLYYPELNSAKTVEVFSINLDMIEDRFKNKGRVIEFNKMAIANFAAEHYAQHHHARWNGRQIRNACQTALALAEFDTQQQSPEDVEEPDTVVRLKVEHFETVRNAYLEFTKYMHDLYGINSARKAKESRLRAVWVDENNQVVGETRKDKRDRFRNLGQHQPVANSQQQPSTQQMPQQPSYPLPGGYQQPGLQQQYHPQPQQNQTFGQPQIGYATNPATGIQTQQYSSNQNWGNQGALAVDVRSPVPSREPNHALARQPTPHGQQSSMQQPPQHHQNQPSQEWLNNQVGTLWQSGQQGGRQPPPPGAGGEAGYPPGSGQPGPSDWPYKG